MRTFSCAMTSYRDYVHWCRRAAGVGIGFGASCGTPVMQPLHPVIRWLGPLCGGVRHEYFLSTTSSKLNPQLHSSFIFSFAPARNLFGLSYCVVKMGLSQLLEPESLSPSKVASILSGLYFLYFIGVGIHRLYFSPYAKFPGPKLAGLTYGYMFYYDALGVKGQYIYKIQQLHEEYSTSIFPSL
jgi:hypothetical protein